jgi:SNF2 family DNA or RNA helicase
MHRPGQNKHVHVHRIISNLSVEVWIIALQKLKLAAASIALHGSTSAGPTIDDVRTLYETHLKPHS